MAMKNKNNSLRQTLAVLRREDGLTLLELLTVLAIVVAVAGITSSSFNGVDRRTRADLTRTEMMQVAAAIRQFRQDTGYYPKQGIFGHVGNTPPGLVEAGAVPQDEFDSPANFYQLFSQPTTDGTVAILPFDENTGRGWRGPYLTRENLVDVGDDLKTNGDDDLDVIATAALLYLPGVADPQEFRPVVSGGNDCDEVAANTACILDWRPIIDDGDTDDEDGDAAFLRHGRPFLYFIDPNADDPQVTNCAVPCLVALGANGFYEQGTGDDIVVSVN